MKNQYSLTPGHILTIFEKKYFIAGILLICIGPLEFSIFYTFMAMMDIAIAVSPAGAIIVALIPAVILQLLTMRIMFNVEDRTDILDSLGIVRFPIFALHAGIVMIVRIIFVLLVRIVSPNREFRLNDPYIFRDGR